MPAKIAVFTRLLDEAYQQRMSLQPGQECESAGAAMVYYRERRWKLINAMSSRKADRFRCCQLHFRIKNKLLRLRHRAHPLSLKSLRD